MLSDSELEVLLADLESDRTERKASPSDWDRIRQAVCAFANDMPDHGLPGVLFIGAHDDGSPSGLPITDELLLKLAGIRDEGQVLPIPALTVQKRVLRGAPMAVVHVLPSDEPPVRFQRRVWIRVGPRRSEATPQEERILAERRRGRDVPYELRPVGYAAMDDLDLTLFRDTYLPATVDPQVLADNGRSLEDQLVTMRFAADTSDGLCPTVLGLLVCGLDPKRVVGGAWFQFGRVDGTDLGDPILDQKDLSLPLPHLLARIDDILRVNISTGRDFTSQDREVRRADYPIAALQQLVRNAVQHRTYEGTNAPTRVTWFTDRVEIHSPGGPYGEVTSGNFGDGRTRDYRNARLTEAMHNLGYVQHFGWGIPTARRALAENDNPDVEFVVRQTDVLATVRRAM